MEHLTRCFRKYKYVFLILAAGLLLMLLPSGRKENAQVTAENSMETYSLEKTQADMEEILRHIDGVGQIKIMLTLKSGSTLQLAQDNTQSQRETESKQENQIVKINRGSGGQEVVVTEQIYPTYQGAVVVCQGAEDAQVRLRVIEAVTVLTGLSSEKISVVKWES